MPCLVFAILGEWYLRGQVARSGLTPFELDESPDLPYRLRREFRTLYKGVEVELDARGLRRGGAEAETARPLHLALVGDSVTFGNAIEWEDTLPVLLQQALLDLGVSVRITNAGVPGFGAEEVASFFHERVLPLSPTHVVYVFVANDVTPAMRPRAIPADAQIDAFADFPLGSALLQFAGVRAMAALRAWRGGGQGGWVQSVLADFENGGRDRVETALDRIGEDCREDDVSFQVAAYPFLVHASRNPYRDIEEWVESRCAQQAIPFHDLRRAFAEHEHLESYWANPFDSHPDGEANRRVADWLAQRLVDNGMFGS